MVVLNWPPPGHRWIGESQSLQFSDAARPRTAAENLPLATDTALQLEREWSLVGNFGFGRRELSRDLRYIAPTRISEFESSHPSQGVRSLACVARVKKRGLTPDGPAAEAHAGASRSVTTLFQLVDFRRRGGCPARRQAGPGATLLSRCPRGPRGVDAISTVRQPGESEYRMVNRWRCLVAAHAALLAQAVILSPATKISCFRPLFLKSTAWFVCSVAGGDARLRPHCHPEGSGTGRGRYVRCDVLCRAVRPQF